MLPCMLIFYVDEEMMEKVCHHLAVQFFDQDEEPIAPYQTCDTALLNSALNLPKVTFDGKQLYPDLIDKAAVLYYTLIKNHPFENGNKRIATATLLVFLAMNYCQQIGGLNTRILAQQAIDVAKSDPVNRIAVIASFKEFLERAWDFG